MSGSIADYPWHRGDFLVIMVVALGTALACQGQSVLERHARKCYNFIRRSG